MNNVIWKAFKLSDNFCRQTPPSTNTPAKELNISDEPFDNAIALITRAESNNGIKGYIEKGEFPTLKNKITYNDQFSLFLFHNYEFTTIKDHLSIFSPKNEHLKQLLDFNPFINIFFVNILNYIFSKDIFNFNFTRADFKFDRELILLPCLEVGKGDEYIWEENGHYYTLAVEYIKQLMDEAKELREQKTIRLYEAERAKYEAERAKYEEWYKRERSVLVWKGFTLKELFVPKNGRDSSIAQKNIDKREIKDDEYNISIVTESTFNNGIGFFMKENDPILIGKIQEKGLTFGTQFGNANWHNYRYFIIGNVNYLIFKDDKFKEICSDEVGYFLATIINKTFKKSGLFGYGNKIDQSSFCRELILLPCLEVGKGDEYIWEENGHYYTLAVNYISYIYLTGKMKNSQKKIDNYTYQY